jgi:hypothetical protein
LHILFSPPNLTNTMQPANMGQIASLKVGHVQYHKKSRVCLPEKWAVTGSRHMNLPVVDLQCVNEDKRKLDFSQYIMSLILNVVAAGSLNFDDVANAMTLSFCKMM